MKKKLLALFLCCALSFGLVTAALITPAAADSELMIYSENVAVDTVSVPKNEKKTLAAGGLSGYYQWQIQVGGDVWANIAGATGAELEVGYALVANLLYGGTANIRCRVTAQPKSRFTPTPSRCRSRTKRPSLLRRRLRRPPPSSPRPSR